MLHPKELTIAASRGNLDLVKSIHGRGIDINAEGEDGKTALMLACEKGHEEIVEYLIVQGADMTMQTDWGYTALTASMVECEGLGNIRNELIITLIESGVDVNAKTRKISPLIAASGNGNVEIVSKLIKKGAKVSWKTSKLGEFPLLYATGGGHVDVVKILIEYGAKVNWKNHYGRTALGEARKKGFKEIEKMLIDAGAS